MTTQAIDSSQVEVWLNTLREEKAALEARLVPLLEERRRLEEQEEILLKLLVTTNGGATPADAQPSSTVSRTPVSAGSTIREEVESKVIEILDDAGEPLHINEIHTRYRERGWKVPGAGAPANITSHIGKSSRIKSPRRGIYQLVG